MREKHLRSTIDDDTDASDEARISTVRPITTPIAPEVSAKPVRRDFTVWAMKRLMNASTPLADRQSTPSQSESASKPSKPGS